MVEEHTPEPWHFDAGPQYDPRLGNIWAQPLGHIASADTDADGRRIVACVNACAGISTEHLEAAGVYANIKQRVDLMKIVIDLHEKKEKP